jgi:predicted O-linked N-acetylglucosamine transferase (SPINDLY family)
VQCLGLGHPETTGYGTLDYFLSSALMEPAGSEAQYTERLVRLPNLSIYYEPVPTIPVPLRRGDFGLRPDATVFWSCQSLYKFLPQHDEVFPRIAREAGNCQFAFVAFQQDDHTTSRFRARLERAFAAFGLQARDYCVILPRFDQQQFIAFAGLCDIVLDSIAWSGFNTTLETLASDLPVVTLPGEFARARHTAAVLEMIGVTDTIAASLDQYVEMAVRLARDPAWRDQIKTKMRERKARIYRDRSAIRALEEFLDRAARTAQS